MDDVSAARVRPDGRGLPWPHIAGIGIDVQIVALIRAKTTWRVWNHYKQMTSISEDLDGISGGGLTSRNTDRVGSSRSPGHKTIPAYNNVSLLDNIIEVWYFELTFICILLFVFVFS